MHNTAYTSGRPTEWSLDVCFLYKNLDCLVCAWKSLVNVLLCYLALCVVTPNIVFICLDFTIH